MTVRPILLSLRQAAILIVLLLGPAGAVLSAEGVSDNYKLQPMDLIRFQVFQEPDMDREVRVSRSHTITLPLIGTVDLKGKSMREAEQIVTGLYRRDYLVNPQVNMTIVEYAPRLVNVLGAVNSPGSVPIPPEGTLTVLEAITRSGGFARIANRTKIVVTRTEADGSSQNYQLDGDQLVRGAIDSRWQLQPGDVIFIPESIL